MKKITLAICALFAVAAIGCHTTDYANDKIEGCLEDEYGAEEAEELLPEWELTCEEGEEACDECIDCVVDNECTDILDGECAEKCE